MSTANDERLAIHTLAKEIAAELPGWRYAVEASRNDAHAELYYVAYITDGVHSVCLDARNGVAKPGNVELRGALPRHTLVHKTFLDGPKAPEIQCSIARGAAALAGDVKRRLLPALRERHLEAAYLVQEWTRNEAEHDTATARLVSIPGTYTVGAPNPHAVFSRHEAFDGSIAVDVRSATSCKVEIHCTPDVAEQVLRMLLKA